MVVGDIYPEPSRNIFGQCSEEEIFPLISRARDLLANKSPAYDPMLGEMTVCAQRGIITLPPDVLEPLGLLINGVPAIARDLWYQYHINGTGRTQWNYSMPLYWDNMPERPIIRELPSVCRLMAVPQYATDNGKSFRVFGKDENDREIYTLNADGTTTQGFLVTMNKEMPVVTDRNIKYIDRILREATNGYVKLYALNSTSESMLLGDYEPQDTQPLFRRIRVQACSQVRMQYRRRMRPITSVNDFIPIANTMAMILAMKAIKFYLLNNLQEAQNFEANAVRLLNEEQDTRNAQSGIGPQINIRDGSFNPSLYGMTDWWGAGCGYPPGNNCGN